MKQTLQEFKENYETDFNAIDKKIRKSKAKTVVLQFPDGLKPYSLAVKDYLQNKFPKLTFAIWLGTCFGACDVPPVENKVDLVIQFGHSEWKK